MMTATLSGSQAPQKAVESFKSFWFAGGGSGGGDGGLEPNEGSTAVNELSLDNCRKTCEISINYNT